VIKNVPPLVCTIGIAAFAYAAQLPLLGEVAAIGVFLALAYPGAILVRRALGEKGSALEVLVFGAALGLALGRLGIAAAGLVFGPGPLATLTFLTAFVFTGLTLRPTGGILRSWDSRDALESRWILGMVGALLLVIAIPYAGIGRPTASGHAFAPYFDRDYLNHIGLIAELGRSLPPENPFFAGERLHYYWSYHLLPASIAQLTGVSARDALNLTQIPTIALFVAALGLWARTYIASAMARWFAVAIALFAPSLIGLLYLLKTCAPSVSQSLPIVSHAQYSFLSHSWFRDCLYEPHAVTALTLLMTALFLSRSPAPLHWALTGSLVGVAFGTLLITDAFIGAVGILYFAIANTRALMTRSDLRGQLLVSAAVVLLIVIAAIGLEVFPFGGSAVRLTPHNVAKFTPIYLPIELGPLFVLGIAGACLMIYRRRARAFLPLLGLLGFALLLAFVLRVEREPNIALRKGLKVAQLPLLILAGSAISTLATSRRRTVQAIGGGLLVASGAVTICTDTVQYLDLSSQRYPPTTYVSADELELLRWIRTSTPQDAVIQCTSPDRIFGDRTDLLIPGLAERRAYYGNDEMPAMFQVPATKIGSRKQEVQLLFEAATDSELWSVLKSLPPVYLYVEQGESGPGPAFRELIRRGLLHEEHRVGRFSLLKVVPPESRADPE